jgi:hypothetical protein
MVDNEFVFSFPSGAVDDEQLPGLSKIETIDYRRLLRRGDRCGALERRKKGELKRKHHAALSAHSIDMAANELAVLKKTTEQTQS